LDIVTIVMKNGLREVGAGLGAMLVFALVFSACGKPGSGNAVQGIVVINAPATGKIRRLLVSEGSTVKAGTPILEISVELPSVATQPKEDPLAQARNSYRAAEGSIATARADVERAAVEVQRVTSLVASESAPPSQLDAARAQYQQAQQRLDKLQSAAQEAQSGLVYQEGRTGQTTATVVPEEIVTARATSDGIIKVLNANVGERVTSGQPLATMTASNQ
jgi:multidrug efflux pump subunit AcrA (membrane-fusion protein)